MAVEINIPDEALPDLKLIAEIEDLPFESLITAIQETEPTLTSRQLVRNIAKKVNLPIGIVNIVVGVSFVLFSLMQKGGDKIDVQEFSEAVVTSDSVANSDDLSDAQRGKLKDRILKLLSLEMPLGVTSKAVDVMTEHDRIFCDARILSDIRPVFAGKPENASAAVVIHNLQIGFHHHGKHDEFFVALDTADLNKLKSAIDRAQKKQSALEAILKKSEVPYLQV